jgi:hypothetical protein
VDLSFSRFEADASVGVLPPDLAILLVGVAARQAGSPTALIHGRGDAQTPEATLLSPLHGAFNAEMAAWVASWKQE